MHKAESPDVKEEFERLLHEIKRRVAALSEQLVEAPREESTRVTDQDNH